MKKTDFVALHRRGLVAAAAAVMAGVSLADVASAAEPAEAISFAAALDGRSPLPRPCPDGAYLCTEAAIEGIGQAEYRLFRVAGEPSADGCVLATVVTIFTVADGSRLSLAEERTVCGPGQSLAAGGEYEYGNPTRVAGTWTVQNATGQFAGFTGDGTSTAVLAGARFTGSYVGTLIQTGDDPVSSRGSTRR